MTAKPRLVHVDDWLAVVDKPAGLIVHAAPGHHGKTLVDELGELLGGGEDPVRPGIVHRLDRDTSGLMLVARTPEAHARLGEMIRRREVTRRYLTLVEGVPRARSGTIDAPLGRDYRAAERRAVGGRGARDARTHFQVLEVLPADAFVEARLETGRTHQIRAHFAAIGHPVCGDPRYGHPGRHGLQRQFLHSARLGFEHPGTGEGMEFESELPGDLREALGRARERA
jgi:23S rRNA pseudouridine1911/1915/1917 synthase